MKGSFTFHECDVLVIGSGLAGLRAALEVKRMGKEPLIVSKSPIGKANNTTLALGSFSCATERFSHQAHIRKTMESGKMINDRKLVETFVMEGPEMGKELEQFGIRISMTEIGFSTRLTSAIGGAEMTSALRKACLNHKINTMEGVIVTALISRDGACHGAVGIGKASGEGHCFRAGAVILATGGAGGIYSQHDNAPGSIGDGYALALNAGLELIDMEFVQFFPLVYAGQGSARMILPPALADLGRITNRLGEDIKEKYGLHDKPIAILCRDRLSRAMFKEVSEGNGVDGSILLDLRGVPDSEVPVPEHLKSYYRTKTGYGSKPIGIRPAAHHTMGGIQIDPAGRTSIKGIFAAGEVTGGIHGANRMGGNALTEAMVFGALAGRSAATEAARKISSAEFEQLSKAAISELPPRGSANQASASAVGSLVQRLGLIMWEKVGIIRNRASLEAAIQDIDDILSRLQDLGADNPRTLSRLIELQYAAATAMAIAVSALERTESRGAHFRQDHPEEDPAWLRHIHVALFEGRPRVARVTAAT